jgi:hypothetical protein
VLALFSGGEIVKIDCTMRQRPQADQFAPSLPLPCAGNA